jgi:3-hydroxyacyl-CoA dehydrogenase/enoyl-CoA hydratase/3-hydroxybutyryl-CoA epimerase
LAPSAADCLLENSGMSGYRYERDADGIVTVTLDMVGQSVNTMNDDFPPLLADFVARLQAEAGLTGVILTSAKSTFFAGGDIKAMVAATEETLPKWRDFLASMRCSLRALESLKVPVVAAINGAALGGGLEIALCCHHRIAIDSEKTLIGLPEATLGLLPGAGGIVRSIRLLGIEKALPLILKGSVAPAAKALERGQIDELASDADDLLAKARAWIRANPEFVQPWNRPDYKIPGDAAAVKAFVDALPAQLAEQFAGNVPPAQSAILRVATGSLATDVDGALEIESREFLGLLLTPEAKAAMQAFIDKSKKK